MALSCLDVDQQKVVAYWYSVADPSQVVVDQKADECPRLGDLVGAVLLMVVWEEVEYP